MVSVGGKEAMELINRYGKIAILTDNIYAEDRIYVIKPPDAPRIKVAVERAITDPSREQLEEYLLLSGYTTVDEWLEEFRSRGGLEPPNLVVFKKLAIME